MKDGRISFETMNKMNGKVRMKMEQWLGDRYVGICNREREPTISPGLLYIKGVFSALKSQTVYSPCLSRRVLEILIGEAALTRIQVPELEPQIACTQRYRDEEECGFEQR